MAKSKSRALSRARYLFGSTSLAANTATTVYFLAGADVNLTWVYAGAAIGAGSAVLATAAFGFHNRNTNPPRR